MPASLQSGPISAASHAATRQPLDALLHAAGVALLDELAWIKVSGGDRVRWLNGMVTNSIHDLAPGGGCYNFALNAQGRIQGDLTAFALENSLLLETSRDQVEKLIAHLDHFIIMDDVELTDITAQRSGLLLAGPQAAAVLQGLGLTVGQLTDLRLQTTTWNGEPLDIIHAHSPLVPRIELWSANPATIAALTEALTVAGATPVTPNDLEHLRLLEGTPRYGVDIRDTEKAKDLPQETAQPRALHFTKGCYLGQEIVERIHSRGNVHRTFTGFQLRGVLPAAGTAISAASAPGAESKPAGEITSVAAIALPGLSTPIQLALGYLRREALAEFQARHLTLTYPGGTATPIALPYAVS